MLMLNKAWELNMDPSVAQPTNPNPPIQQSPPATAAPAPASPLPSVPSTWPGAFGAYKYSKQAVKPNVWPLVSLWLINLVISFVVELALKRIGEIIAIIIGSLLTAAILLVLIASVRGRHMSVGEALSEALPLWLKMIGLQILVVVSVVVSALLLIVPFFFVLPRLVLSSYFLVDKRMGVIEAYKASWAATKGNAGKIWGMIGATFLMVLLMITIIGIPFAIYFLLMYSAALAVLYEFLTKSGAAPAPTAAAPQAAASPPPAVPPVPPTPPTPVQ